MSFEIEHLMNDETGTTVLEIPRSDKSEIVNLQMVLVTTSMNHEYTRKAYEQSRSYAKKQELLVRMTNLKNLYFTVRQKMSENHPDRLISIEDELRLQKMTVLSENTVQ